MKITKHLTIDMVSSGVPAVVDVMQSDEMTRQVSVSLYDAGRPWEPPEGVEASVSFRKPDNVSGWYDTMPDGSAACTIAGNLVTAQLVPEITQISGLVSANIIFRNADLLQVGSFPFVIRVIPSPAAGVQKSNPYYKVSSLEQLNKELAGKADKAQIAPMIVTLDAESGFASNRPLEMKVYAEAGGNVYLNTGETLIPLDATNDDDLAVFTWIGDDESVIRRWSISDDCSWWYSELPIGGTVKTVNGTAPDENGNVQHTLIVTMDENNKSSHTSEQIYAHIQKGGAALFDEGERHYALQSAAEDSVVFTWCTDDDFICTHEVCGDTVYYYEKENVTRELFDSLTEERQECYMVKINKDPDTGICTLVNFDWDALKSAVKADKNIFCRVWEGTDPEDDPRTKDYQFEYFSEGDTLIRFVNHAMSGKTEHLEIDGYDGEIALITYTPQTGITKKLLWENASPRSSFAEQQLAVDMTGYDEIEVEFSVFGSSSNINGDTRHKVAIPLKKSSIYSGYVAGAAIFLEVTTDNSVIKYRRDFEPASMTELYFFQTVNASGGKANTYMIPNSIYGIKGVQ